MWYFIKLNYSKQKFVSHRAFPGKTMYLSVTLKCKLAPPYSFTPAFPLSRARCPVGRWGNIPRQCHILVLAHMPVMALCTSNAKSEGSTSAWLLHRWHTVGTKPHHSQAPTSMSSALVSMAYPVRKPAFLRIWKALAGYLQAEGNEDRWQQ